MTDRMKELEAELQRLKDEYPTRYVTQTEMMSAMDVFAERIENKIDKAFDRHEREHARDTKERDALRVDVNKNRDNFYSLRNWGAISQAALSTLAALIGVSSK